jgi:hypothetical protein
VRKLFDQVSAVKHTVWLEQYAQAIVDNFS